MLEIGTVAPDFSLPDQDGRIAKAFGKVKPKDNAKQMLKEL